MANIGRGKSDWLDVAVALHPGVDAGAAETLDEAVFFAFKDGTGCCAEVAQGRAILDEDCLQFERRRGLHKLRVSTLHQREGQDSLWLN